MHLVPPSNIVSLDEYRRHKARQPRRALDPRTFIDLGAVELDPRMFDLSRLRDETWTVADFDPAA